MPYDGRLLAGVTVLMAVVEAGTMTRAAEALGLTQSGVGRAIQRLEARVGVRLLDAPPGPCGSPTRGGFSGSGSGRSSTASRRRRSTRRAVPGRCAGA